MTYLDDNFELDQELEDLIVHFSSGKIELADSFANDTTLIDDYVESCERFYDFCNGDLNQRINISQKLSSSFRSDRKMIYDELNFCLLYTSPSPRD